VDEPTFKVSELTDAVQLALDVVFPDEVWVQGEISSLKRSPSGHVYFQLIEPGAPGAPPLAQISVTLFAKAKAAVNATLRGGSGVRMTDGVEIRIRGRLGLYGPQGRIQLRMSAVDPEYTLGRLAGDRDRLLQILQAEGLLARNGRLALAPRPLLVGLATSAGSAAEADFLHELTVSGLAWDVVVVDCRVQGADAERSIVAALRALAGHGVDTIALVRGGGARTDLATFDGAIVAREIAAMTVPVITGIGHEIDTSVADQVAHTACKTPTACAAALVSRARTFHDRADRLWVEVAEQAQVRCELASRQLATHGAATARAGHTAIATADQILAEAGRRLGRSAGRTTEHAALRLDTFESRVGALDPTRALQRGWSITRRDDGTLVRGAAGLSSGTQLVTQFADGSVRSRVVSASPDTTGPDSTDPTDPRGQRS